MIGPRIKAWTFMRAGGAIPLLFILSACQMQTRIEVTTRPDGKTAFTVTREDGGKTCVRTIGVQDKAGKPLWRIAQTTASIQANPALCLNRFILGETPAGFEQTKAAEALKRGADYNVSIGGAGLRGDADFIAG
jgi:hypothetical protein